MTVYIVFQRGNPVFDKVYTNYEVAQQAQAECNLKDAFYWWDIVPIELVTDAFMELTLQPHKPRPFKELI